MDTITSVKNQYVRLARALSEKKERDESGMFLAEGVNLLRDMPKTAEVQYFLAVEDKLDEAQSVANRFPKAKFFVVTESVMKSVSDTVTPYGIAAVVKKFAKNFELPKSNALLLDRLSDAGNVGTILRTAAAADFKDVYLFNCADVFSPKVVRASLGGIFKVNCFDVDENQALEVLANSESYALDMSGDDITLNPVHAPATFVLGNEAHGVSQEFLQAAKRRVSIPMKNDMESLNVAIAAAIAMYGTKRG